MSSGPEVIIIRKKAKGHAAHGAAWKVAYADFVTAMMALFMVLWLVSQTDQPIKKLLSDYFRTGVFAGAPSILEGGSGVSDRGFVDATEGNVPLEPAALEQSVAAVRDAVNRALQSPETKGLSDHVTVRVTEDGILVQIADGRDDMVFDRSSSELKPALIKLLADLAPTLAHIGYGLELHGHTDARPFPAGSGRNNWTLSFERAEGARAELEKHGLPPGLILGVYAHGATVPVDKADPKSPKNRRLAIFARRLPPASAKAGEPPGGPSGSERKKAPAGKAGEPEHASSAPARGRPDREGNAAMPAGEENLGADGHRVAVEER